MSDRTDELERTTIDVGDECVMCFFMRETGKPPSIKHIIKSAEPWPDTCKLHLEVLDSMKFVFGDKVNWHPQQ